MKKSKVKVTNVQSVSQRMHQVLGHVLDPASLVLAPPGLAHRLASEATRQALAQSTIHCTVWVLKHPRLMQKYGLNHLTRLAAKSLGDHANSSALLLAGHACGWEPVIRSSNDIHWRERGPLH